MLLDVRNGPAYDTGGGTPPHRWWFLASSPRTGSTLLCRALWDTGLAGAPKEYLNPTQIRDWEVRWGAPFSKLRHRALTERTAPLAGRAPWSAARRRTYLERIAAHRAGPTGWVGLKVHHHHYARWFGEALPPPYLGEVRWIRVLREDRLSQAISWDRALQSRAWAAHQPTQREPKYRRSGIDTALAKIRAADNFWAKILVDRPVLTLTYEAIASDLTAQSNRVLDWLGEPGVSHSEPALAAQSDQTSDRWRARYEAGE